MARSALGTKRVCPTTGRKFYDLNKEPIISPYTGQVVTIAAPSRSRPEAVELPKVEEVELDTAADVELISLEEADDETAAVKDVPEDDIEIEDDTPVDDTFLEEEDEGEDVTDLIGDGIEDEEEP